MPKTQDPVTQEESPPRPPTGTRPAVSTVHASPPPARPRLPGDAHPGQEVGAGRGRLVEHLVAARAVVADPRRRHEDPGVRLGRAQALDEIARPGLPRGQDRAACLVAPALVDPL